MKELETRVSARKAWIGWWVDGYWCPTRKIRDHWIHRARRRKQMVTEKAEKS